MLFFSVYCSHNYPLEILSKNFFKLGRIEYSILFSTYSHFVVIYSFFHIKLVCLQFISIIDVYSYYNEFFNAPYVLLSILIYFLNIDFKYFLFYSFSLESSSLNTSALSLYLWCDFRFINLRTDYYSTIDRISKSAYVMSYNCFFGKNCYRRYFISL